jgi:23S rRNA (pseudouridine1915-N3)-methyltransferase
MRVLIAAIGRFRKGPERDLYDAYVKRMRWPLALKELDARGKFPDSERKSREGALLLDALAPDAAVIALDERGKNIDSEALARWIGERQGGGQSHFAFVIGGADGLDEAVRKRADLVLSFGAVTWPHMLVRAMLAEQIYRAETILAGHPYHRGG